MKTEKLNLKGLKAMRTGLNTEIVRRYRELKDQLRQRPSVKLPNEEFNKSTKKFVPKTADPLPRVKITIRVDAQSYKTHKPELELGLPPKFIAKMRQGEIRVTVNPVVDTGAQATIMGDEHGHHALMESSWAT